MFFKSKSLLVTIFISLLIISCNGREMQEQKAHHSTLKDIPASAWKNLAEKKIYFGHQSVGFNIIDGMKDLINENIEIKLNIVETHELEGFFNGVFAHSRVGKNRDPKSKIDEFADFIDSEMGNKTDLAFFKFCYVDFSNKTDFAQVFRDYRETMKQLKEKYPKVTFIHVTVPLLSQETGLKPFIKKIIGRAIRSGEDNIVRTAYNRMIRKEYSGKELLFDLAKIESTLPDGQRSTFEKNGKRIFQLAPQYTEDGGHLNKCGRKIVAEQLLIFLANLLI